jgi:Domain of unknown function (DUF4062)
MYRQRRAGDGVMVRAPWKARHGCCHGILTIMKGIDNAPSKSYYPPRTLWSNSRLRGAAGLAAGPLEARPESRWEASRNGAESGEPDERDRRSFASGGTRAAQPGRIAGPPRRRQYGVARWQVMIRTPDQRVRVFVSSTLEELAGERQAVTAAITQLRLTPVLFELGARPYPPRDLYRAYLQQSDVFIGIYAESYGWVGPGMEVSGLEDEYRLSAGMPRLIYAKKAAQREPRLTGFLERIETEGVVSRGTCPSGSRRCERRSPGAMSCWKRPNGACSGGSGCSRAGSRSRR